MENPVRDFPDVAGSPATRLTEGRLPPSAPNKIPPEVALFVVIFVLSTGTLPSINPYIWSLPIFCMRLVFKKGKQRELLERFKEANSFDWKQTARLLGVHYRTLKEAWRMELYSLPSQIFEKILLLKPEFREFDAEIETRLEDHWGSVKGGKRTIQVLLEKYGEQEFVRRRKNGGKAMNGSKNLVRGMTAERLQKILKTLKQNAKRRLKTSAGYLVRNDLELRVAEFLFQHNIEHKYEPIIKLGNSWVAPDFFLHGTIIECTASTYPQKLERLKEKVRKYNQFYPDTMIIVVHVKRNESFLNMPGATKTTTDNLGELLRET